jgi:hypothetical protein
VNAGSSGSAAEPDDRSSVPDSVPAVHSNRSGGVGRFSVTVTRPSANEIRIGSYTFFRSSRPGDGVRSGYSNPSITKLPSCNGSP